MSILNFLYFFLSIGGAGVGFAQNTKTDSLLSLLKKDKEACPEPCRGDTNRVNHLNALGSQLMYNNPDTSIILGNQALALAKSLPFGETEEGWKKGIANSFGNLGAYYHLKADYPKALTYYLKALKIDEELGNKTGIASRLGNIGIVYGKQADYPKALDYYLKALKIDEELENKNGIARHLGNIGIVYKDQADYPKALDYYLKALKISEELENKKLIANQLGNIGNVYYSQADYPKALGYYLKSLKIAEEIGNKKLITNQLGNIGAVYADQADYPKALDYNLRALKMAEELGNKNGIASWLGNIGAVYAEQGKSEKLKIKSDSLVNKALDYYFKALKMTEEVGNKNLIANWLGNIGSLYTDLKNYKDACDYLYRALALSDGIGAKNVVKDHYIYLSTLYEKSNTPLHDSVGGRLLNMEGMRLRALYYHKRYINVKDTLFSEENKKQLVRKEMNFEFEKKEAAAKAEQEKQQAVAAAESRRQRIVLALVSCFLLLVLVLAGFIFRSLRITRRQKNIIVEQKKLVDEKQKDILDSIYYARRIQRSLLTSEKYIERSLNRLGRK